MAVRIQAQVTSFGGVDTVALVSSPAPHPGRRQVLVRVTHASVGSTDLLARRGGYLLQPLPGFTLGYDFVGVLETTTDVSDRLGLRVGDRVAGCLPRMGAHSTHLVLDPTLLVEVPDALASASAATAPLDLLTAGLALRLAQVQPGGSILIQGVTGAVGAFAAELAGVGGLRVFGTASARSRAGDHGLDVTFADYADPRWPRRVREASGGGVDAAIDHTGSPVVKEAVAPTGTLVHTAFVGRTGQERPDTAAGALASSVHRWARPRERVCSVPLFVATNRREYRTALTEGLRMLVEGELTLPAVVAVPFGNVWEAHRLAERPETRSKVVLEMTETG